MKIKTLAVIGLLALAPVQTVELNAATNPTVKVARDDSGKVDYKNFYKNGTRVKYENWDNGKKTSVINYKSGKVSNKTYYSNGVETKYEKWSKGKIVQRNVYVGGKVDSKTFYNSLGKKTRFEDWTNGSIEVVAKYKNNKLVTLYDYNKGRVDVRSDISGSTITSYKYNKGNKVWKQTNANGKYKCYSYKTDKTSNDTCSGQYDYAGARVSVYK